MSVILHVLTYMYLLTHVRERKKPQNLKCCGLVCGRKFTLLRTNEMQQAEEIFLPGSPKIVFAFERIMKANLTRLVGMLTFQSSTHILRPSGKQSLWQHFEKGGTFRKEKKKLWRRVVGCLKYSIWASQQVIAWCSLQLPHRDPELMGGFKVFMKSQQSSCLARLQEKQTNTEKKTTTDDDIFRKCLLASVKVENQMFPNFTRVILSGLEGYVVL